MKREDVSKIIPGITPEQLDSILNLHGADITAKVNEITTLKAEKSALEQLVTAGITTVAALVSWWENNSFTSEAIRADAEYERLKKQSK